MSIFLTWFDATCDKAKASPVGKILTARGFDIAHTGGRCLAWEKRTPSHYCRITAHGADLGDEAARSSRRPVRGRPVRRQRHMAH